MLDNAIIKQIILTIILLIHLFGMTIVRWLFFAEAEHVVGIYYSKR